MQWRATPGPAGGGATGGPAASLLARLVTRAETRPVTDNPASPLRELSERLDVDYYERSPAQHFRARAAMITAFADGAAMRGVSGRRASPSGE
jgi:hypothetical protein